MQEVDVLVKEQTLSTAFARLEGIEEERKRIARELHDGIGVKLSTAKLYFAPIDNQLADLSQKDQEKFQKANNILDEAYIEVRKISHNLASPSLSNLGLLGELKLLAKRIEGAKQMKVNIMTHNLQEGLAPNIEIVSYRIISELITNVLKHAQATEINIQLNLFDDLFNLMVEDNGIGFDQTQTTNTKTGLGLENIQSRVEALQGTFNIDSGIGKGTTITVDLPIQN